MSALGPLAGWEPGAGVTLRSAMHHRFDAAGATFERRGGDPPPAEADRAVVTVAPGRWIVIGAPHADRQALDMTGAWSLLAIAGPEAARLLRRLGPVAEVPGAGPLAGVPGRVFRRHDVLWAMTASEFAQHLFDVCADLCAPLGGGPVGLDAIARATADPLLAGLPASAAR